MPDSSPTAAGGAIPTVTETILVIDDEEIVVRVTKDILEAQGYKVLTAHSGAEAIDLARAFQGEIHLAILDISMPILDGAATYPLLKQARPDLKVLLCSGCDINAVSQSLFDAGVSAFLQKPFRIDVLNREVRRLLDG